MGTAGSLAVRNGSMRRLGMRYVAMEGGCVLGMVSWGGMEWGRARVLQDAWV